MSELLEKILSKDNMNTAYKRVCANKGAGGVDEVTIEELGDYIKENWESIRNQIRRREYLRFGNFDWDNKKLSIIQHKTHKPLSLPIPDAVGWAVIDYIKNGRPKYYDTDVVFVKHMPPFDPLSDNDHLENRIIYHMRKAGIRRDKNRHSGFHSLRHCAGSMLLEMETPLPVITSIMGHSDTDVTGIYLKTDLKKLSECVLTPPVNVYG